LQEFRKNGIDNPTLSDIIELDVEEQKFNDLSTFGKLVSTETASRTPILVTIIISSVLAISFIFLGSTSAYMFLIYYKPRNFFPKFIAFFPKLHELLYPSEAKALVQPDSDSS